MIQFTITNPPAGVSHTHVFNDRKAFREWYNNELRPQLGNPFLDNDNLVYNGGTGKLEEQEEVVTTVADDVVIEVTAPGVSAREVIAEAIELDKPVKKLADLVQPAVKKEQPVKAVEAKPKRKSLLGKLAAGLKGKGKKS